MGGPSGELTLLGAVARLGGVRTARAPPDTNPSSTVKADHNASGDASAIVDHLEHLDGLLEVLTLVLVDELVHYVERVLLGWAS